jgi:SSS family solute:Na+ symporter
MGGMTAVIYTDTVQWIVLLAGLAFLGLPLAYHAVGGWELIVATLPASFFSLSEIRWFTLVNWAVTIIPIWFIGMTLYQRIYASRSEKQAQKAWFIAGFFEWPFMAFMGVLLGLFARVAAEQGMFEVHGYATAMGMDAELGLPLLLREILPIGLMGVMMSVYFSAILSTADSCLMAASGNVVTDILGKIFPNMEHHPKVLVITQVLTLLLGITALILASQMTQVLDLMLYSYAFMVSGLFVPLLAALYLKNIHPNAALAAMLGGGVTTLLLSSLSQSLPGNLDANIYGIFTSTLLLFTVNQFYKNGISSFKSTES